MRLLRLLATPLLVLSCGGALAQQASLAVNISLQVPFRTPPATQLCGQGPAAGQFGQAVLFECRPAAPALAGAGNTGPTGPLPATELLLIF